MRALPFVLLALVPLCPLALAGCESSQTKSKRLAKRGVKALNTKGLEVKRSNPDIKPIKATVLGKKDSAAVVVVLRNTGAGEAKVPISIDVQGATGKSVFKNDTAGLEKPLVSAAVVPAHGEFSWVNDQVFPSKVPRTVKAKVGLGRPLKGAAPKIGLSQPKLSVDSVSGIEASGQATNRSQVEQRQLVIYCVARRGGRIVAAGRGQIEKLKVGPKKANYHVFFIGDPRGAQLSVTAPPTVLN